MYFFLVLRSTLERIVPGIREIFEDGPVLILGLRTKVVGKSEIKPSE